MICQNKNVLVNMRKVQFLKLSRDCRVSHKSGSEILTSHKRAANLFSESK